MPLEVNAMRKKIMFLFSLLLSLVLCGLVLFVPMGKRGMLWNSPCVNAYSLFCAIFLVINTILLCDIVFSKKGSIFGEKPYTQERPIIEEKKRQVTAVVMTFFEMPLLLTVFFINDGWKMAAGSGLCLAGLLLGLLIGEMSANNLRRSFAETEQRELKEQLRKEEGYR